MVDSVTAVHPIEQLRYVARASGADARMLVVEATSALAVFADDPAAMVVACRRLLDRQPSVGPLWWMATRLVTALDVPRAARELIEQVREDATAEVLAECLPQGATVMIVGSPDVALSALSRRGDTTVLVVDVQGQGHMVQRFLAKHQSDSGDMEANGGGTQVEVVHAAQLGGAISDVDVVLLEAAAIGAADALFDAGAGVVAAVAKLYEKPLWLVGGEGKHLPDVYFQEIAGRIHEPDLPSYMRTYENLSLSIFDQIIHPGGVGPVEGMGTSRVPVASELLS